MLTADMIQELRDLRDEATCTEDHCVCERYDRIIDSLESMLNKEVNPPAKSVGCQWILVSQDYARTHYNDHEVYWLDTSDGSESLIDESNCEVYLGENFSNEWFGIESSESMDKEIQQIITHGMTRYEQCWDGLHTAMCNQSKTIHGWNWPDEVIQRMETIENEVCGQMESEDNE